MATTDNLDKSRKNELTGQLSVKIVVDRKQVGIIESHHITECYFIEDIFSPCITGKLVFVDTEGFFENGPFTGDELIGLEYGIEEDREITFNIWKINKIVQTSPTNPTDEVLTEIIFVDETYYNMYGNATSYSFPANTKYTTAVDYLLKNMIGFDSMNINMEECTNFHPDPIALPYWNVAKCIRFLLRRAKSSKTSLSGYLHYNNTDNGFKANIRTLNWLFSSANQMDNVPYIFENEKTEIKNVNKIWEWWAQGIDKASMKPARGGLWRAVDTSLKKLYESEYIFSTGVENTTAVGTKSLFPDISDNTSYHRLTGENTEDDLKMVLYDEWVKSYDTQFMFNLISPGSEKRYAGQLLEIKWPSITRKGNNPIYQKQLNGKFLIKSITHTFVGRGTSNVNYMQRLVVLKNAYQGSESENLLNIPKEKQNISEAESTKETTVARA
jgi:hypothetical protein